MAVSRSLLVLGQTPFPVEMLDADTRVLYCNPAYVAAFGQAASEVLDRPTAVFPERLDGRSQSELFAHVLKNGLWRGEATVRRPEGDLAVRLCLFPVQEAGASPQFVVYYEKVGVPGLSKQTQTGELLNMIAHQWRQPLTVIMSLIGNIQLKAEMGAVDSDYLAGKLERVAHTVQFLSETIDSFRSFHSPSRHKTVEDLAALAQRSVDIVMPSLEAAGVKVEWVTEPALAARVFRGEFQQILLELVNNARESLGGTEAPLLRIELFRRDGAVLRVGNNGPEIPDDVLANVFEPYFSTKESGNGSGLGLHMVKTIVESHHGGAVSASSRDGWTAFTCRFPEEEP